MSHKLLPIVMVAACLSCATARAAYDVRYEKRPAPAVGPDRYVVYDTWCVSAALGKDTKPTVLGACFDTLDEAWSYAYGWIAKNHKSSPPGSWTRIKFVVVEGEPSVRRKNGPTLPGFGDLLVKAFDQSPTVAKVLKGTELAKTASQNPGHLLTVGAAKGVEPTSPMSEYAENIENAYENAKKLKEGMLTMVEGALDTEFTKINEMVADFNKSLDNPPEGMDREAMAKIPRLTPVTPDVIEAARPWKEAVRMDVDVRTEREKLNDERKRLESERASLIDEMQRVDAEEARIAPMRQTVDAADLSTFFCPISGVRWHDCEHYDVKQAWLDRNRRRESDLDDGEDDLRQRRSRVDRRLEDYRADKAAYDAAMASYKQKNARRKTIADRLNEFAFERTRVSGTRRPTVPRTPQRSQPTPRTQTRPGLFRRPRGR